MAQPTLPSMTPPFNTTILQDDEAAIASNKANKALIKVYSDRSSTEGGLGAAAILYINGTQRETLQHHLGSEEHHTVYAAKLVALILAATLIQQMDFLEEVTFITDNQVAIKAITNFCSAPGQ